MDGYRADVVSARYTNSFTVTEHRDRQMKKLILIGVGLVWLFVLKRQVLSLAVRWTGIRSVRPCSINGLAAEFIDFNPAPERGGSKRNSIVSRSSDRLPGVFSDGNRMLLKIRFSLNKAFYRIETAELLGFLKYVA